MYQTLRSVRLVEKKSRLIDISNKQKRNLSGIWKEVPAVFAECKPTQCTSRAHYRTCNQPAVKWFLLILLSENN